MSDDMSDDGMTDEPRDEPTRPSPTPGGGAHRPTPGAQAASRARRIGGRPMPTRADAPSDPTTPQSVQQAPEPAKAAKPPKAAKSPKAAKPAKAPKAPKAPNAGRPPGARSPLLTWLPTGIAAAAAIAALVLCIVFSQGVWWDKKSRPSALAERTQVLAAAKTCVAKLVSYDYRKLADSERAGLACTTGAFTDQYKTAMEKTIKTFAPQSKSVVTFQTAKAGIAHISPDGKQWMIVVYGQQSVSNTSTTAGVPRLDIASVQVTMNKVGSQWLVSNLQ
jgi:Mce-associated membrane protein